jgi:N-acetylglucosamine-6-phosphate deacetylase
VGPAGMGPGRYQIGRFDVVVGDDLVARAPDGSHLVGSVMTMPQAVRLLVAGVGLTREEVRRLTVENPRIIMGRGCECDRRDDRGQSRLVAAGKAGSS